MKFLKLAAVLATLTQALLVPVAAKADITTDTVRQKAEQACYDDVNRLCADAIPDEEKIKACMKVHRKGLSPKCREVFDSNVK